MRLDKMLGNLGYGTRSEIKKFCRQGMVIVNGEEAKKSDIHVNPELDEVLFNGKKVNYREFIYLMLNKPSGYVSATFDKYEPTVIELIDEKYYTFEPFPVGRLDKDTEGLLILTNDGQLSHRVLSPKKHVPKKYYAIIDRLVKTCDIEYFEKGIDIGEEHMTKPAKLEFIGKGTDVDFDNLFNTENDFFVEKKFDFKDGLGAEVYITISEGKFHQIKRMLNAVGKEVLYLKRIKMGELQLDETLELGEYRELTAEEISMLEGK